MENRLARRLKNLPQYRNMRPEELAVLAERIKARKVVFVNDTRFAASEVNLIDRIGISHDNLDELSVSGDIVHARRGRALHLFPLHSVCRITLIDGEVEGIRRG